jgi:hypothetical protein
MSPPESILLYSLTAQPAVTLADVACGCPVLFLGLSRLCAMIFIIPFGPIILNRFLGEKNSDIGTMPVNTPKN